MGNTSSTPVTSSTTTTTPTTTATTETTGATSPAATTTTTAATTKTTTATITPVSKTSTVSIAPITITTRSTTPIATTPTPNATSVTPTPTVAIRSSSPAATAAATKDSSIIPASVEGASKPTFYSIAKSLTADADPKKSAASAAAGRWYKWSKFEEKKRDKGKSMWYMGPSVTTTDTPTATTTTLTMTTAKIDVDQTEASNITAVPSFQLRSTAIYSPPHGDRILSGRNELINTDISSFKYYQPDNRSNQVAGHHTKATMYQMNTRLRQTPLLTQTISSTTGNSISDTTVTADNPSLPTFVSRGLQTDLETQPVDQSSTQIRYYEKQQPRIVPVSAFSTSNSNNNGFYHLSSLDKTSQPVLPSIDKTSVWINDQPLPSPTQSLPSFPPPTSILKKPSKLSSQQTSNPLSTETYDKAVEEFRKTHKNSQDGIYRVKKVHLIEKSDIENQPSTVSFNLPPPTKARQSILRSEKLLFS